MGFGFDRVTSKPKVAFRKWVSLEDYVLMDSFFSGLIRLPFRDLAQEIPRCSWRQRGFASFLTGLARSYHPPLTYNNIGRILTTVFKNAN